MVASPGLVPPANGNTVASPALALSSLQSKQHIPPLPLLALVSPSQLGASQLFSVFPIAKQRALHRGQVADCTTNNWPLPPWKKGLFSARRQRQAKAQLRLRALRNYSPKARTRDVQTRAQWQPPSYNEPPDPYSHLGPAKSSRRPGPSAPPPTGPERTQEYNSGEISDERGEVEFLKSGYMVTYILVLIAALVASAVWLNATADMGFRQSLFMMSMKLLKTSGFRQTLALLGAILFVRFGLEPVVRVIRLLIGAKGPWRKSSEYYLLREVYRPIEWLLAIAACCTLVENFTPYILQIPKATVHYVVHAILSLTFIMATANVVFNVKARMVKETTWQLELNGKVTQQRRIEAIDKLLTLLTALVSSILGLQAVGLDVNSLLAIGGIGGLAAGLAGRELLENLFNGLIIMSSNPFEVGEEVLFQHGGREVEGIVLDVGWYRTTIRSFEREVFIIPNSVFSKTVVLNITRKNGEWRLYEFLDLRPEDISVVSDIVSDMRKFVRSHPSVLSKLHRRVFLHKMGKEECRIYISFYCSAADRDAFMAIRQDIFLTFMDIIRTHGGQLARPNMRVYLEDAPVAPPRFQDNPGGRRRERNNGHSLDPQEQNDKSQMFDLEDYEARRSGRGRWEDRPPAPMQRTQEVRSMPPNGREGQVMRTPREQLQARLSGPELAESIIYGQVLLSDELEDDDDYELPRDDLYAYVPSYFPKGARMKPME